MTVNWHPTADHTQNTDTKLDEGGGNEVTAAEALAAYTHSTVVTGNPHNLDAGDVGADPAGTGASEASSAVGTHEGTYSHGDIATNSAARHAQGTDQALDAGGVNEITAANAKAAYTHSTGDGSDHGDVASNTAHAAGDGSDHADVATNTSHATGDGSDHADVASNTSHRGTTTGNPHSVSASDVGAYEDSRVDALIGRTAKPAGYVRMVSIKEAAGNISGQVKSTTGYIAVRWWDGTVEIVGNGTAGTAHAWSKAVPSWSSAWSGQSPKEVYLWSCTGSSDPTQSGDITYLDCYNNSLTSLDVSGLTALEYLNCYNNSLTSLDVSGLTALYSLYCSDNSLTSLDVSGLTALTNLSCYFNSLTLLDVSGCTALTDLDCSFNSLTSLRAVNVVLSYSHGTHYGSRVSNNSLDAAALDQFYDDLGTDVGETGLIFVTGNPGADDGDGDYHDYTIATGKGYTIVDDEGSFT